MMNFHSHPSDPLIYTAGAYYIIGLLLIVTASMLFSAHPVNRVFLLGKYLTPDGARVLMKNWPFVSMFGLFIFSCAVEHHLHWLFSHGYPNLETGLLFMGWIEAGISIITALIILIKIGHWGWGKWSGGR
jgi:hypothetical protein